VSGIDGMRGAAFQATGLEDLARLPAFLDSACAGVDAAARADLRLAIEEVFANIFRHGYRSESGLVGIDVEHAHGRLTVVVVDDAPHFDPASAPAPDLDADWDARAVGGLGWHLVRQVMDEVRWEPGAVRGNTCRLVKNITADAADPTEHRNRSTGT
jgi:anti-sigma regulatory factor (Ser/Thr protein kinase)